MHNKYCYGLKKCYKWYINSKENGYHIASDYHFPPLDMHLEDAH